MKAIKEAFNIFPDFLEYASDKLRHDKIFILELFEWIENHPNFKDLAKYNKNQLLLANLESTLKKEIGDNNPINYLKSSIMKDGLELIIPTKKVKNKNKL